MLSSLRTPLLLASGIGLGAVAAVLIQQSLIGPDGSPEQRAAKLEVELRKAQNRIAALEALDPRGRRGHARQGFKDGLAEIRDKLQDGEDVTPEDVFRLTQPWMRDLAPLFERMRVREEKQQIEQRVGELARKHDLTPAELASLRKWFDAKSEENARNWTNLVTQEGVRLQDLMKASRDVRSDDGLDAFMSGVLRGERLAKFQTERNAEKAQRVQQHADSRTQRLDEIVSLDDAQRDQVFSIMARGAPDYDPSFKLEGAAGELAAPPEGNRQQAVLSILRPEQREAYQAEAERRREKAVKDMEAIGLSLPADWDPMEMENF